MQKVSFSFPPELVKELDRVRGSLSRNQFVLKLVAHALKEHEEDEFRRLTAEVYGDNAFAEEEERLAEDFLGAALSSSLAVFGG